MNGENYFNRIEDVRINDILNINIKADDPFSLLIIDDT